ncbi:hypothetical protein BKA62DRAFT_722007 [Auriculariales sp. MPI-PUGE-AT-0066]|nr:hypothetical protein BKA62DRAFT_722007 [Auriculariales sp. MPI-PUGE-AT-0066]
MARYLHSPAGIWRRRCVPSLTADPNAAPTIVFTQFLLVVSAGYIEFAPLSVSTILPDPRRLGRTSFSSEASSLHSFSLSSGGTSPDAASSPGTSVGASSGSPRTPSSSSRGYLPLEASTNTHYHRSTPPQMMIAGRPIPQPVPLNNTSTPSTPTTVSASVAASPAPPQATGTGTGTGTKKRRTQTGFIILRPSTNGASLRVAASSASSFSDALDALRHRALPPEHLVDGDEDGWVGVVGAEKPLYVCPFDGCGRKYTFTSNLRRHMRRGHGLAKAGSSGGAGATGGGGRVLVSPQADADADAMDDDAPTPPGEEEEPEDGV